LFSGLGRCFSLCAGDRQLSLVGQLGRVTSEQQQRRRSSVGGGAGLAYVFVHLLPELASGGSELSKARGPIDYVPTPLVEALLFLIALLGVLVVFRDELPDARQARLP
jgi:hypothetical protein